MVRSSLRLAFVVQALPQAQVVFAQLPQAVDDLLEGLRIWLSKAKRLQTEHKGKHRGHQRSQFQHGKAEEEVQPQGSAPGNP